MALLIDARRLEDHETVQSAGLSAETSVRVVRAAPVPA